MKTLYDLLGAFADDDAEALRTAFRKAVKGAHPDINPDDPDAALKFRQIVRANEILSDEEQRGAYDHLLDLAQLEQETASRHAIAVVIHKLASGVMALVGAAALTAGGYLLFVHLTMASVAAPNKVDMARGSTRIAAVASAEPRARVSSADANDRVNRAIERDPGSSAVYLDRNIIFYRPRETDRAFPDIPLGKRIEKTSRAPLAPTKPKTLRVASRTPPVFPRRPASQDLSRLEGFAFARFP